MSEHCQQVYGSNFASYIRLKMRFEINEVLPEQDVQAALSQSLTFAQLHKLLSEFYKKSHHLLLSNGENNVCADDRGPEATLLPGRVQKQFGDG